MSADATATSTRTERRRPTAPRGYEKDRAQLLRRLARIEGQVRGITRMIERDEYCVDVMQQTAALRAAGRGRAASNRDRSTPEPTTRKRASGTRSSTDSALR